MPDSRRHELEQQLLDALRQGTGTSAQRLMAPGVQEGLQQLFLSLSDAVLQLLLEELARWQAQPAVLPSSAVLKSLHLLAGLAHDRGLRAIEQFAEGLHRALLAAQQQAASAPTPSDCQQGAEELARLLFLYAAGQQREAAPDVRALLRI